MTTHDDHTIDPRAHAPGQKVTRRIVLGSLATGAAMLSQVGLDAAAGAGELPELAALDQMAAKPTSLSMSPRVTYLGGPTYLIEIGRFRIVTDPGFDPQGTERSEGPGHVLTKVMAPPIPVDRIGPIDLVLLSHAQHLDNLDNEGRRLLAKVGTT